MKDKTFANLHVKRGLDANDGAVAVARGSVGILLPPGPRADYWRAYQERLITADTLLILREMARYWAPLAPGAAALVRGMKKAEFSRWRLGLWRERRDVRICAHIHREYLAGKLLPSSDEWISQYGPLFCPLALCDIQLVAMQLRIPWGEAYLRLEAVGALRVARTGIVVVDANLASPRRRGVQ